MVGHGVGDHTGVIPYIRLFHFGDVQIPSLLRDEAPVILVGGVVVEDPGVAQLCKEKGPSLRIWL